MTSSLLPFGVLLAGVLLDSAGSTVTVLCLAGWQLALAGAVLAAPSVRGGLPSATRSLEPVTSDANGDAHAE
ncbi:MAG TPA: hypothetical protein VGO80_22155 [Solirubrobacteraceae bacterium]|nr:hypothetical protein [Solirubrobacteraceae bacterium]